MTTIEALLADLKPDAPVRQVLVGAFWTAVVLEGEPPRCRLASTLPTLAGLPGVHPGQVWSGGRRGHASDPPELLPDPRGVGDLAVGQVAGDHSARRDQRRATSSV